ncbi:MAG: hypothetical protein KDE33_14770 [Bacteroidetes bacterium]|nr:hypothetical protein [Bacteroidota bacterium]
MKFCAENPRLRKAAKRYASPYGDRVNIKRQEQMNRQANAPAKSKGLQPTAQSQRFAAHLLLPRHTENHTQLKFN